MPQQIKIKDVANLQESIEGRNLAEKGVIITENFANLSAWTASGAWSVTSNKLNVPTGANNFTTLLRQSGYGETKLRKWTANIVNYIIPTIDAASLGITFGIHSMSASNASIGFRFCCDSTKKGLIEVYYARTTTVYAVTNSPLVLTAGDITSMNVRRILNTMIVTWYNNTTGQNIAYRFEMPANDGTNKPPNFGQFCLYANGGTTTIDSFSVESNEMVGAKLWIQSDSIASTTSDNVNQAYPQILAGMTGEYVACAYGNSDRIEENNWAEVLAHAPKNILISCLTNNVSGDSTATMLTKLASAITALSGYSYGVNLFVCTIMNRNDVDVTAHNIALKAAYSNTIDLSFFKAASGTGINDEKSLDGIHCNPDGHVDYAIILLAYFSRAGKLSLCNYPVTNNIPVYYQGKSVQLGLSNTPPVYPVEVYNKSLYSQLRLRGNGTAIDSGLFTGLHGAGSHHLLNIGYTNGNFVARGTTYAGFLLQSGAIQIHARSGATNGTTYALSEAISSWVMSIEPGGKIKTPKVITAAGTTGNRTINAVHGSINIAAGNSSVVVTNSLVDANSSVLVTVYGNDATAISARVTKASGSFTITLNAAATAEVAVGFIVLN